jgi:hypothetical protein
MSHQQPTRVPSNPVCTGGSGETEKPLQMFT